MAFDDTQLLKKYNLVSLSVLSSTQISSRTSAVLSQLQPPEGERSDDVATIVALTARSQVGSKLISIAEIAKRELAANNVKCFQYNALSSKMIEIERKQQVEDDDSDDAFETMGVGKLDPMKKRKVPVMTIYLSTSSINELKAAFGEQS